MSSRLFTSESVTEGHPDKLCDQISDAILDAMIKGDDKARVACESMVTTGTAFISGEITANCYVDIESVVRDTVRDAGYYNADLGFDCESCGVLVSIKSQSEDIALGVDESLEAKALDGDSDNLIGAGDQGLVFGFACRDTEELMPMPIYLAHKLAKRLAETRKTGELNYLRPDGKSQVTVQYVGERPVGVSCIVVSAQHAPEISTKRLRDDIYERVILPVIPKELTLPDMKILINPTGRFVIGGPKGDCGLTGRKIIVDTYGGFSSHGGGCFSGKDPTKTDRSAAYMARYVAKNIVAAGIADKCEIQVAYAIGVAAPVSVSVNSFGSGKVDDDKIAAIIHEHFDLRPSAIIRNLNLRRPIYKKIAAYGHFGREDLDLPWEKTDRVEEIRACL